MIVQFKSTQLAHADNRKGRLLRFIPDVAGIGCAEAGRQLVTRHFDRLLQANLGDPGELLGALALFHLPTQISQGDAQELLVAKATQPVQLHFIIFSELHLLCQRRRQLLTVLVFQRVGTGNQGIEQLRPLDKDA